MKTKIAAALIAALTLGTASIASTSQAHAFKGGHHGWGWGGVGLGLAIGAAAAASSYSDCYYVRQYDRRGNYIGTVPVCN